MMGFFGCTLIFGCILMQQEYKNESDVAINDGRIVPVDCLEVEKNGSYQDSNSK